MIELERYEWCDFWWEETGMFDLPRILLAGDSITKGYRPLVNQLLKGVFYVDLFATSRAVDNPAFFHELDYISGEHSLPHDLVHLNNGLHGVHMTPEVYETGLESAIIQLKKVNPSMQLVLVTSTPITVRGDAGTLDQERNDMVLRRNEKVQILADRHNLPLNDLYAEMLDRPEFKNPDGVHFTAEGQMFQAKIIARIVTDLIKEL